MSKSSFPKEIMKQEEMWDFSETKVMLQGSPAVLKEW